MPGAKTTYEAFHTMVPHSEMMVILGGLTWLTTETFTPDLAWLKSLAPTQLRQWLVFLPQQVTKDTQRTIMGHGPYSIFGRVRSDTQTLKAISESRHRNVAERTAGFQTSFPDAAADALHDPYTAVITLYPSIKPDTLGGKEGDPVDPAQVTIAFRIITPLSTSGTGRRLVWTTKDNGRPNALVIDSTTIG